METTRKQSEHLKQVGQLKAELGAAQHHNKSQQLKIKELETRLRQLNEVLA